MTEVMLLRLFNVAPKFRRQLHTMEVCFSNPLPGWHKVNTDGAALGNLGKSSCGSIFHMCRGSPLVYLQCHLGIIMLYMQK